MRLHNPFESDSPVVLATTFATLIVLSLGLLMALMATYVYFGLPVSFSFFAAIATLCAPRVIYYVFKGK